MKTSLQKQFLTNENLNDELFFNSLIEELNKIIDDELNKHYEDINAELIDDCCNALTAIHEIQNGAPENSRNIININSVIKKYNLLNRKKYVISAACAAVAFFAVGITAFTFSDEIIATGEAVKSAFSRIEEIFHEDELAPTEPTTLPTEVESTQQSSEQSIDTATTTESAREIKNITVITPADFNSTVSSRDEISLDNLSVSVNFTNGQSDIIPIAEATYEICNTRQDGLTEIKIHYGGFTSSVYVTVVPDEIQNPITVTSIYGTFENKYSVEEMRVFAVFSDGTEKEIPKSDCIITSEEFSDEGETVTIVTVEYENCSFQFSSDQ